MRNIVIIKRVSSWKKVKASSDEVGSRKRISMCFVEIKILSVQDVTMEKVVTQSRRWCVRSDSKRGKAGRKKGAEEKEKKARWGEEGEEHEVTGKKRSN